MLGYFQLFCFSIIENVGFDILEGKYLDVSLIVPLG